jgi:hypothetical protein
MSQSKFDWKYSGLYNHKKLTPDGSNRCSTTQSFTSHVLVLCQEISSGAHSALPMGVAPEAIVEKIFFFKYRLKYSVVHHCTLTQKNLLSKTRPLLQIDVVLNTFKVVAPKAIVECPSGIISSIVIAFVGAILLVFNISYITFIMTSMSTSLCVRANHFVGSIVIFTIFDR